MTFSLGHYMIDATPSRAPNLHTEEALYHEPYNGKSYNYGYYADDLENDEVDEWDYDDEHYNADLAYDGVGDFDTAPYAADTMPPSSISSIRRESPHTSSTHQFQPYFAQFAQRRPPSLPREEIADHLDSDPCKSSPVTATSFQLEKECKLENGFPKEDFTPPPEVCKKAHALEISCHRRQKCHYRIFQPLMMSPQKIQMLQKMCMKRLAQIIEK